MKATIVLSATAVLGTVVALAYAPMWVSAMLGLGLLGALLALSQQLAIASDRIRPPARVGVLAL